MARRHGIYFAPEITAPLWQRASAWLGRDAAGGAVSANTLALPDDRTGLMRSAIRYGFHATLKAPMTLRPGVTEAELVARVDALARTLTPVSLGTLQLADLDGFLALVPEGERPGLLDLAARVVMDLDDLRAPLSAEDRARRGPLDPRGAELLETWGYPHVLERFQFHMTLTDRLADDIRPDIRKTAEHWFAGLGETLLDRLVIFTEDGPGAAFVRGPEFLFVARDPMTETILSNARIVLPDEVVKGTLVIRHGLIAEIDTGGTRRGDDLEGDFLIPGLIELHTDHFENHYRPRPGVTWNAIAALQSHDAQVAGAGITTVFDAIRIGSDPEVGDITDDVTLMVDAVATAQAENRLRAEHRIHLRCELPTPDAAQHFEAHAGHPLVGLASLMDHTPGARQYATLDHYVAYYQKKLRLTDDEMAAYIRDRKADADRWSAKSKTDILALGKSLGLAFASHDDATPAHVAEAIADGVVLAEFPTTLDAARTAHQAGMAVLMGAPNLVRGKSHNGNVSALDLARAGTLDVLSSDYVPFSLLQAAFLLPELHAATSLPQAIRMVTRRSAEAVGLTDRGALAPGLRADLVRVWRPPHGVPVVRAVWREGQRVS